MYVCMLSVSDRRCTYAKAARLLHYYVRLGWPKTSSTQKKNILLLLPRAGALQACKAAHPNTSELFGEKRQTELKKKQLIAYPQVYVIIACNYIWFSTMLICIK